MRSAVLALVLALAASAAASQGIQEVEVLMELCNMTMPTYNPYAVDFLGELEYASIPNAEIAYYRFGNASMDRPAVMLVPGLGSVMSCWPLQFLQHLAKTHEVIIFDNRGQGLSKDTNPEVEINPFTMANDTRHLSEALDLDQPILMGWSMGGMITLTSAALFPDSYNRFVAFSGAVGSLETPMPDPNTILQLINPNSDDPLQSIDDLFPLDVPSGLEAACWFYAQGLSRLQIPENSTTTHRQLVGLIQYYTGPGVYDLIHTIEKPVMLFSGGLDKIVPPIDQRVAAKQIREPWLITYPDAAHAAFIQHLPTTISAIDLFLAQEDFDA